MMMYPISSMSDHVSWHWLSYSKAYEYVAEMAPKEKRGAPESKSRLASFIKKKRNLMKKADELSILCGVEACVICLSPETSECDVWSSTPDALSMLKRYRELKTEDKSKRKVDLTDVMRQRIRVLEPNFRFRVIENGES